MVFRSPLMSYYHTFPEGSHELLLSDCAEEKIVLIRWDIHGVTVTAIQGLTLHVCWLAWEKIHRGTLSLVLLRITSFFFNQSDFTHKSNKTLTAWFQKSPVHTNPFSNVSKRFASTLIVFAVHTTTPYPLWKRFYALSAHAQMNSTHARFNVSVREIGAKLKPHGSACPPFWILTLE